MGPRAFYSEICSTIKSKLGKTIIYIFFSLTGIPKLHVITQIPYNMFYFDEMSIKMKAPVKLLINIKIDFLIGIDYVQICKKLGLFAIGTGAL